MDRLSHDSPIEDFFSAFSPETAPLRDKLHRQQKSLIEHGFVSPGALLGTLTVEKPPGFEAQRLTMTAQARMSFGEATNPVKRKRQLASFLHLSDQEVDQLVKRLNELPRPLRAAREIRSGDYFGLIGGQPRRSLGGFHYVDPPQFLQGEPSKGGRVLLPDLDRRLGEVWHQGARGTCVAFAATGLVHYLRGQGGERPSPQFLYHQCKLLDGNRGSGTFLEIAMHVLSNRTISGENYQWGIADAGIPNESAWPYVTREAGTNEAHTPPPNSRRPSLYRSVRWANTKGEVLRTSSGNSALVHQIRYLISQERIPVVVGVDVFPTFKNAYSDRTGRITLPIGKERLVPTSAHAMLVVGYDDTEGAFLIRNSWGSEWAAENPWQAKGHAILPYAYFERYSRTAYTMRRVDRLGSVNVPEAIRLYSDGEVGTDDEAEEKPIFVRRV